MAGRRILLTNCELENRAGTQLYIRDLALGLQRAGHRPMVFSPLLGEVANDLLDAGVPVTNTLGPELPEPDVLHCHHQDETQAALARFPDTPALYVAHDAQAWQDEPPIHPRLLRYLAVDEVCRERLIASGIASDSTAVIANSVDLNRFAARSPLPGRPVRALVFGNAAAEQNFIPAVRQACTGRGIALDVAGGASGQVVTRPELVLGDYDLIFAKGRAALEALAVGCAVIVADVRGIAGLVSTDVLGEWRRWNFGRVLLTGTYTAETVGTQIDRYDAADAAACKTFVRSNCDLTGMVDALVSEYEGVIKQWSAGTGSDYRDELRTLSSRLELIGPLRLAELRATQRERDWQPIVTGYPDVLATMAQQQAELAQQQAEMAQQQAEMAQQQAEIAGLNATLSAAQAEARTSQAELSSLRGVAGNAESEAAALARALHQIESSRWMRLHHRLLASPVGALMRWAVRRFPNRPDHAA
jgi:hypothetical protein